MLTLDDDNVVFSGRSEVIYSHDERENLVLSTRVLAENSNYSVAFELAHPINSVDLSITGHAANGRNALTAGLSAKYMNARHESDNYQIYGEIQKVKKSIKMLVSSPVKNVQIVGQVTPTAEGYSANIAASEDNEDKMSATANINTQEKSIAVEAKYSRGEYMYMASSKLDMNVIYRKILAK